MKKRRKKNNPKLIKLDSLEQINLNAAGLFIGSEEIWACVPEGRDTKSVRVFPGPAGQDGQNLYSGVASRPSAFVTGNRPSSFGTGYRFTKSSNWAALRSI